MNELLPCPMCGCADIYVGIYSGNPVVGCKQCPVAIGGEESSLTEDECVAAWNTRPHPSEALPEPVAYMWEGIASGKRNLQFHKPANDIQKFWPLYTSPNAARVPDEVMIALDRMCTPLHSTVLHGGTAEADARCMKIIRDYILRATPSSAVSDHVADAGRMVGGECGTSERG